MVPQEPRELLTVFKVESVEIQPFHEVAQSLRLEGSHPRVTHLPGEAEREKGEVISLLLAQKPAKPKQLVPGTNVSP